MTRTSVLSLTDADFTREVLGDPGEVLVVCYSELSPVCRMTLTWLEQLCTEQFVKLKFVKFEIGHCPSTARRLELRTIPTLTLFRGGRLLASNFGLGSKKNHIDWIKSSLKLP